ncbi:hypothetical protein Taro_037538 [Colocasia esculenta]|uniref:Uncharacterized protein n=1 Tax=Colocasia esculenta TaxID=4460 RepID=A0A843WL33_COLES|nr:hypothetical protein [Colocasia esculenta]
MFLYFVVLCEFLLLWLERDWFSLLSLVARLTPYPLQLFEFIAYLRGWRHDLRGSLAGVREVASFPAGSKCELQESVASVAGYACFERGCYFARAVVGFVFGLCIRVGVSRRLREPTCCVAFTGAGLLPVDPGGEWRLSGSGGGSPRTSCVASTVCCVLSVGCLFGLRSGDVFPD